MSKVGTKGVGAGLAALLLLGCSDNNQRPCTPGGYIEYQWQVEVMSASAPYADVEASADSYTTALHATFGDDIYALKNLVRPLAEYPGDGALLWTTSIAYYPPGSITSGDGGCFLGEEEIVVTDLEVLAFEGTAEFRSGESRTDENFHRLFELSFHVEVDEENTCINVPPTFDFVLRVELTYDDLVVHSSDNCDDE